MTEKKKEKKKRGRPSTKTPMILDKILELTMKHKTDEQIGEIIGKSAKTIKRWRDADWEFCTTMRELQQESDELMEASLFKKGLGFTKSYTTQKVTQGVVKTVKETVYIPPDTQAMKLWLTNRTRNRKPTEGIAWRDRVDTTIADPNDKPLAVSVHRYVPPEDKDEK